MKIALTALIGVAVIVGSARADGLSIKKTLLTSFDDPNIKELEENTGFLKKGSYGGIPLIEDIEFRLRNEAFIINRMRYNLRIQPRGFGETRAANRYNKSFSLSYERKALLARNQALRDRYIQILDQMEQQAVEEQYKELIMVYEDMIKVMEKKKFDVAEFDLNDLIDGEDKNTKIHNQIYELKRVYFNSRYSIENSLHDTVNKKFDTTGFVNVDSVIALIERNNFSFDTNNVYLEYYRLQHEVAKARYDLEKAERRQYISLLSASYDNGEMLDQIAKRDEPKPKDYNLNYSYLIEIGVKIPDLTMARHDLARRKADYLSEKEDYEKVKLELISQMKKDKEDLLSFIAQYRFLKARENEVDANSSLKKYLQMTGVDPLILLAIKESIVKNHVEIAKLKFSILRNYIQVIDVAGELSKPPLRNFLSQKQEIMQP
jgi:hypothetical protein